MSNSRQIAERYLELSTRLGEGPVWDDENDSLLFVDILEGLVFIHSPRKGLTRSINIGRHVGAVVPRLKGGLVVAVREGFGFLDGDEFTLFASPYDARPNMRMNDAACDPIGRWFAGSMAYDGASGAGEVWRLDLDQTLSVAIQDVTISNGMGWSADGRTCFYIDTPTKSVDAFDYDVDRGVMSKRRIFADLRAEEGLPDGLALDSEGGIWVAMYGGGCLVRLTPRGNVDCRIEVPLARLVTSCVFGGDDLSRLFITTAAEPMSPSDLKVQPNAGGLFVCEPGWAGLPPVAYGG